MLAGTGVASWIRSYLHVLRSTATAAAASQNANEAASRPQNTLSIPDHTSQGPPTDPDGERPG